MKSRDSVINQKVDLAVATVDSLDLLSIFALFLSDVGHRFLEETGRFFMFPIAAMAAVIRSILAWRQASLDGGKNGTIARAVVETAGAAAITVAVIGGLATTTLFATISPIIFTATLAAKTLFHLGSSIYYMAKSFMTNDSAKKQQYRAAAYANAVGTVALALATVAVGFVMLAAKPIIAILGVLAGVIGTAYGLYKLCTTPTPPANGAVKLSPTPLATAQHTIEPSDSPSNSARLRQRLLPAATQTSSPKEMQSLDSGAGMTTTKARSSSEPESPRYELLASDGMFGTNANKSASIRNMNDNPGQDRQINASI